MAVRPFGAPDAASAELDLQGQLDTFVNIDGTLTKEHDAAIPRVIFGRKGSGKSHYLRALNAVKAHDASVLAFGPSTDPPHHDWVIKLSLHLQQSAIPMWIKLWQKAILASAAVTLLSDNRKRRNVNELFAERLEVPTRVVLDLKALPSGHMTPFQAAQQILSRAGSLERFYKLLDRPQWQELERELEPILAASPPLYFFLDNLDHVEPYAPRPWQSCQRGLLEAILTLASDNRWRRIHVVVALRDTVVQPLFDSAHGQRYINSPMLHRLEWSTAQSQEFLHRKINLLSDEWLTGPTGAPPMKRWLARDMVENTVRMRDENLEAYLLRHTLLLPRDIVEMGNSLCKALVATRAQREETLSDNQVRLAVNRTATQIGKTGVFCSGIEVARRLMPSDAPLHGIGEAWGLAGEDAHRDGETDITKAISEQYASRLTHAVRKIGEDRFDGHSLAQMKRAMNEALPQPGAADEAIGALWRLGMVGLIDGELETGEATFYGHSEHDGPTLPAVAACCAFHPSMIDFLGEQNVRAIGDPVYPEPGFLKALGL